MAIEVNPETLAITVDPETRRRLTVGTPFQRSMNSLAMMVEAMMDTARDIADAQGLAGQTRKKYLKECREELLKMLLENPPPTGCIDPDALALFCGA